MDGNFSAEHMRCRGETSDPPLSAGMAFMANPNSFNTHLLSGQEYSQVCHFIPPSFAANVWNSPAHVTHTRPLSRPIPVGHILMLQASGPPPAVMASLCPPLWSISRRVSGVSNPESD